MSNHAFVDKCREYRKKLDSGAVSIIDVETTLISNEKYKTVFNNTPEFICAGVACLSLRYVIFTEDDSVLRSVFKTDNICVGHNITYDLLIGYSTDTKFSSKSLYIWDTMLAEYLLSDQVNTGFSLEQACEFRGITLHKEDEVSQLIKSGVCPSTIDKAKLHAYLEQDVLMTKELYLKQKAQYDKRSPAWQSMFINQQFFLLNILRASCNGMKIDEPFVTKNKLELKDKMTLLECDLIRLMWIISGLHVVGVWNPGSNADIGLMLYGGIKKYDDRVQVGVYKTGLKVGQPRYKVEKKGYPVEMPSISNKMSMSVDEEALKTYLKHASPDAHRKEFIEKLLEYKDVSKDYNTYYEGYMNFQKDGFINPKYNHGYTPTGRLTCSKPNLQNIKS